MTPAQVPSGWLLVDTDVFTWFYLRKGPFGAYEALVQGHQLAVGFATAAELMTMSVLRLGERRRAEIMAAIRRLTVITSTVNVVETWAQIHAKFHGQLGESGANDAWNVACAVAQPTPLPIVTGNARDYERFRPLFPDLVIVHPDSDEHGVYPV